MVNLLLEVIFGGVYIDCPICGGMASSSNEESDNERKPMVGFRADTPLYNDILEYREERNLSKSDAVRELVRKGLEAEEINEKLTEMEARLDRLESRSEGIFSRFK